MLEHLTSMEEALGLVQSNVNEKKLLLKFNSVVTVKGFLGSTVVFMQ